MNLAVPVWQGRVSPVLDSARTLLVFRIDRGRPIEHEEVSIEEQFVASRVRRLLACGVDVLICGAVSRPLAAMLEAAGVEIHPWVTGPVEEVIEAFLAGEIGELEHRLSRCGGRTRKGKCPGRMPPPWSGGRARRK